MCRVSVWLALLFCPLAALCGQAGKPIRQIELTAAQSMQGGKSFDFLIQKDGDSYYWLHGPMVKAALVEALSTAVAEPVKTRPTLSDLGVTPALLRDAAPTRMTENYRSPEATPPQRAMFDSMVSDPATLDLILPEIFSGSHTDDYVNLGVVISFEDGTTLNLRSFSQHAFLLPWSGFSAGVNFTAWNADISRAVAALLPQGSQQKGRLAGSGVGEQLAWAVMKRAEARVKAMQVVEAAGTTLQKIRARYTVNEAEVREDDDPQALWHVAAGRSQWFNETGIQLDLNRPELPRNFDEQVELELKAGHAVDTGLFLAKAEQLEKLVLSVSWLARFLDEEPGSRVSLSMVHHDSLTNLELEVFSADMHAVGRDVLADEVQALQARTAVLVSGTPLGRTYWLVLPDRRVILWRSTGDGDFLRWNRRDFSMKPCGDKTQDEQQQEWRCAGQEIGDDGFLYRMIITRG